MPTLLQAINQSFADQAASGDPTDPISAADAWDTYTLNGFVVPGVIAPDGIRGFDRETVWDKKKGKGQSRATLTLTQEPPAEGLITSLLWRPAHFEKWDEFVSTTLAYYSSKLAQTNAATIVHPALAQNGINNVVVAKVGVIRHLGKKLYSVTVTYIEWSPPAPKSIVTTPKKADPVKAPDLPGNLPPDVAAAQAAYYKSSAAHAAAAGAP